MTRFAAVAVVSIALAVLVACEISDSNRASETSALSNPGSAMDAVPEALSPELAAILREGPGGPIMDDEIDLDGEGPLPLRIVLDEPSR